LVVVIAGISIVLLNRSASLQVETAAQSAINLGLSHANDIQRRYEVYLGVGRVVAQIMNNYADIDVSNRRDYFQGILEGVFTSNTRIIALYAVWKPNFLDDDSLHIGEPGTSQTGQFIPLYSRETGSVVMRICRDYEEILDGITNIEYMSDPEPRIVADNLTYTFDMVIPIIANGTNTITGAVGIIVDISFLQPVVDAIKPYDGSIAAVYSNNGTILAHYNKDMIGKNINDADSGLYGDHIEAAASAIRSSQMYDMREYVPALDASFQMVFQPVVIGGMGNSMSLMLGLPESQILSSVQKMIMFTIILAVAVVIIVSIIIFFVSGSITKPIVNVTLTLKDISEGEGDLTKSINYSAKDEIGDLSHYFNQTMEKIKKLIVMIKHQAAELLDIGSDLASNMTETAASVNQIAANIQSMKSHVGNQSAEVDETGVAMEKISADISNLNNQIDRQSESVSQSSSAIEEMLANIQSVTSTLIKNASNVRNLAESSGVGRAGLEDVAAAIQGIARESEGLLEINSVMENIASQTNLLSMNAAIEAAHAGEAGKGFAVVADEIRKLAESSSEQSKTIGGVLKKIKDSIDKITRATDEVLSKFEIIDSGVRTVSEQEENIRNAMEEQGQGSKQILEAVSMLNEITGGVKVSAENMNISSKDVIQTSRTLESITREITNGMSEMAAGADQINTAVTHVNSISEKNKENIDVLVREVSKFKVD
jgi:methyl-accepting chemotaxis protein